MPELNVRSLLSGEVPAAFLLLHMQNQVVAPEGLIGARGLAEAVAERDVLAAAREAGEAARAASVPVLHVVFEARAGSCTSAARGLRAGARDGFVAGSWGTRVAAGLSGPDDDVLTHDTMSAFAGTNLGSILQTHGVGRVVLGGVSTHLVVSATAFAAADEGFEVAVLADACAAPTAALHEGALTQLAAIGDVVTL